MSIIPSLSHSPGPSVYMQGKAEASVASFAAQAS